MKKQPRKQILEWLPTIIYKLPTSRWSQGQRGPWHGFLSSLRTAWHLCYSAYRCSTPRSPMPSHRVTFPGTPEKQACIYHTTLIQCQNNFPNKYGNFRQLSAALASLCSLQGLKPKWDYYLLNRKKKKRSISAHRLTIFSGGQWLFFAVTHNGLKFLLSQVNSKGFHEGPSSLQRATMVHCLQKEESLRAIPSAAVHTPWAMPP